MLFRSMLPDTGERYMTTPLFYDIPEEMTEEEWEIARSTPSARFDLPQAPAPSKEEKQPEPVLDRSTETQVEEILNDPKQPVVLFALEWCEFCWSVRKMFAQCKIPYRSVDLDSVQYQKDNQGGKIRAALTAKTGCPTIPQIFVGDIHVGGCDELYSLEHAGKLEPLLNGS